MPIKLKDEEYSDSWDVNDERERQSKWVERLLENSDVQFPMRYRKTKGSGGSSTMRIPDDQLARFEAMLYKTRRWKTKNEALKSGIEDILHIYEYILKNKQTAKKHAKSEEFYEKLSRVDVIYHEMELLDAASFAIQTIIRACRIGTLDVGDGNKEITNIINGLPEHIQETAKKIRHDLFNGRKLKDVLNLEYSSEEITKRFKWSE